MASDDDMFYPFGREETTLAPLPSGCKRKGAYFQGCLPQLSTKRQRDAHGPNGLGQNDAIIAERDNARAGGRR